ncbi:uncharacterized protein LOC106447794 [Brassica napus]|uniref:uncharacterized protein LOC106447794 n=1 Tax=Brassica napus TaxID=3708 RepID=UPI002078D549|nr:uncharacterized protein LOC106447794 [Brassica napus]
MDVSEDLARDYPPRLYPEGASIFENKSINTNSNFSEIPRLRQAIGIDVWDNLKTYPVGLIAKLAESKLVWSGKTVHYLLCRQLRVYKKEIWSLVVDQPLRFSLIEIGEITGLNTNPLPEENFEPDPENYKALWELLKVPLGYGPKFDELIEALTECPFWSADQRKWYGLLFLQAIGLYGLHHNCRIPFESAKRVFDDDALMTYPWGRTAYEFLVDSIKLLHPQGGSYTLSGFKDVLLVWAYESVTVFGELYGRKVNPDEIPLLRWGGSRTRASLATTIAKEMNDHGTVRVRKMVMKEGLEELFPQWKDEADDPQLDNLIKDIHADRFVRDFYVQSNEKNKKTKAGVSSEAEPPSKKQKKGKKQKEVKINEGETAVVEEKESAKEKGRSEAVLLNIVAHLEKLDRKFDSRLTEYDTKFGDFSQGLLDTIGDTVKTTVEERLRVLGVSNSSQPEGQHVMVSEDNQQPESNSGQPDGQNVMVSEDNRQPDSNSGQPASKTPIDKQSEDSQPQKTPDKGQSEKNLADDIAKADAKGMGAKLNSKVVRDKAPGVKKNLDSAFGNADATNADLVSDSPGKEPPFGRGCRGLEKRNNLAADLERNEAELKKKQKEIPHGKLTRILSSTESSSLQDLGPSKNMDSWFKIVLIQRSKQDASPFWSKRVAFIDSWFLESWVHDYKQFEVKPEMVKFKGSGYEGLANGLIPTDIQTKLRWFTDVDHLYGVINTGGNHWVAFHVDLHKEKVDCYDSIVGEQTLESDLRMLNFFGPLTRMLPAILNALIPDDIRVPTKKKFVFRRRTKRIVPQNNLRGDCGVYSLKFVECLALGVDFDGISDENIQGLRMKMAADVFNEGSCCSLVGSFGDE